MFALTNDTLSLICSYVSGSNDQLLPSEPAAVGNKAPSELQWMQRDSSHRLRAAKVKLKWQKLIQSGIYSNTLKCTWAAAAPGISIHLLKLLHSRSWFLFNSHSWRNVSSTYVFLARSDRIASPRRDALLTPVLAHGIRLNSNLLHRFTLPRNLARLCGVVTGTWVARGFELLAAFEWWVELKKKSGFPQSTTRNVHFTVF